MKKLFTLLALTITFSMSAQLAEVSEGGNKGQRLETSNAANHGDIGNKAVDLSYTDFSSTTSGATGNYSTAMGYYTTASGEHSTAMGAGTSASGATGNYSTSMGYGTTAIGDYSTAMGYSTTASGDYSTAMGNGTSAIGDYSTVMGEGTLASADYSTAMGYYTSAVGDYSTAMGVGTRASGDYSTAMGIGTFASGESSTAMGGNTFAVGDYSTAMGERTTASDYASLVIGIYNSSGHSVTNTYTSFSTSNTAFVIGNGANENNRTDALTVLFDGTTTIAGDLSINSDARLKANIISLGSTLAKLLQIDGKTYTMKKDENKKQKIGVLAQDIEKVFPEPVSYTHLTLPTTGSV